MSQSEPASYGFVDLLLPTAIILGVIYADVATFVNLTNWRARMPIPYSIYDNFRMFQVFDSWEKENVEFEVDVLVVDFDDPAVAPRWIEFDLRDYYSGPLSDTRVRISRVLRVENQRTRLAEEIKRVYRSKHPDAIVERVRFFQVTWPKSTAGYLAEKDKANRQLVLQQ